MHYSMLGYATLHCTTVHILFSYVSLLYLRYTALHCILVHCSTLHYTAFVHSLRCLALFYTTRHCIDLHFTFLNYASVYSHQAMLSTSTQYCDYTTMNFVFCCAVSLQGTLQFTALSRILRCFMLHYFTTQWCSLHYIALNHTTLHCTPLQLKMEDAVEGERGGGELRQIH